MKKILALILVLALIPQPSFSANQWRNGDGEESVLQTTLRSVVGETIFQRIVDPLDRLLTNYRQGARITYLSAATLTVGAGEVVCSNGDGSIRLFVKNTSATTVTWADIDTESETVSTQYYVYAVVSAATDATFIVKISTSSTAPSGATYYKRLGAFYNDASGNITQINNDGESAEFGAYESKTVNVTYQATSDGDVTAFAGPSTGIAGYTDSSSTPTTMVALDESDVSTSAHISFSVMAGDYWKVTGATTIYWRSRR